MAGVVRGVLACTRLAASAVRAASSSSSSASSSAATPSTQDRRNMINEIPDSDILQKATVQPIILKPFVGKEVAEEDRFGLEALVHVDEMFAARLHLGHKMGTLHPNMKWSLFGERLGVCVFDLDITRQFLMRALNFVAHVAARGGIILFVSSSRESMIEVERTAEQVGQYAHVRRWEEGTLTNTKQLLGATVRLPDTLIFLSSLTSIGEQHPAILEAAKMAIPTVGIVDSNADPAYLTYLIPANDDSPQAINYLLRLFKEAVQRGTAQRDALRV